MIIILLNRLLLMILCYLRLENLAVFSLCTPPKNQKERLLVELIHK